MNLTIDAKSPLPVYQQVIQAIKLEILSGSLRDGDQLPSIRDLAKLLKLNPNTVAKAYYALEAEGFSENRSGSGSRVKIPPGKQDSLRLAILESELKNFMEKAVSLGFSLEDIHQLLERIKKNELHNR
ncbi:MAG TPA: GntR family transcriptional regulator [Candidatus Binatia bacterium]|nr:GntR family transcriptional regulator [Candidatus Binatia bacterium]